MRIRLTFTCMIAALFPLSSAFAARIEEVVKPTGFLLLGNFRQWASLAYEYNGHKGSTPGSGTSTNHFMEKYHFTIDAGIIDPSLLKLQLDSDIWFDQSSFARETGGEQSSKSFRYQYSLVGSAFDRKPYPMTIISSRQLETIVTPLIPTFNIDSTQNGVNIALQNSVVPVWFQYMRTTADTSGLRQDYSTTADSFNLRARHDIQRITYTDANISVFRQHQTTAGLQPTTSRNYGITLNNNINFDRAQKYSLASGISVQEGKNGDIPQKNLDWTETLSARFGKALSGKLANRYNLNETIGFDNRKQSFKINTLTGTLSHKLGESLETRIGGRYRETDIFGGIETAYAGSVGALYTKKLPKTSNLTLSVTGEHEITERNVFASQLSIRDEAHTMGTDTDFIALNVVPLFKVVSVRNADPNFPEPYEEGIDYAVNTAFGGIDIIDPLKFLPGTVVLISYIVHIDASTRKYSTDAFSATGNLSLFSNHYRLAASFASNEQNLIAGQTTNLGLNSTRSAQVHFDANYPSNTFSLEYGNYASNASNYTYFEGGWQSMRGFLPLGISLRARDRYTIYDQTRSNRGYSVNTAEIGSSFSRALTSWAQLSLSANYVNTRGENISRDYAYFRVDMKGRFSRLLINLIGQSIFRIRSAETIRDDYFRIDLTRYF